MHVSEGFGVTGKIEGSIATISKQGNLVSDISSSQLDGAPRDESVTVRCDEHETNGIFATDHSEPEMTLIALVGESGNLELEIVGDSAKIMLGVAVGEKVVVQW